MDWVDVLWVSLCRLAQSTCLFYIYIRGICTRNILYIFMCIIYYYIVDIQNGYNNHNRKYHSGIVNFVLFLVHVCVRCIPLPYKYPHIVIIRYSCILNSLHIFVQKSWKIIYDYLYTWIINQLCVCFQLYNLNDKSGFRKHYALIRKVFRKFEINCQRISLLSLFYTCLIISQNGVINKRK